MMPRLKPTRFSGARTQPIPPSMSETPQANAYLRTKVMSATPAELRLMLLDGAVKFACQAREGLAIKNYEAVHAGFSQCRAIVLELLTTIDPKPNPELAENVKALYTFLYSELVESSIEKSPERLAKVIELLEYERETWALLMKQIADEQGVSQSGNGSAPAVAATPSARQPAGYGPAGSSGGLSLSA